MKKVEAIAEPSLLDHGTVRFGLGWTHGVIFSPMDPALEKVSEDLKVSRARSVWTHYAVDK